SLRTVRCVGRCEGASSASGNSQVSRFFAVPTAATSTSTLDRRDNAVRGHAEHAPPFERRSSRARRDLPGRRYGAASRRHGGDPVLSKRALGSRSPGAGLIVLVGNLRLAGTLSLPAPEGGSARTDWLRPGGSWLRPTRRDHACGSLHLTGPRG